MNAEDLKARLKAYAYRTIKVHENLPKTVTADIISKQLLRSSLSAAANYRSATRAQSKKSSWRNSTFPLKKQMNLHFGWK
jgi:four helix bundle protein